MAQPSAVATAPLPAVHQHHHHQQHLHHHHLLTASQPPVVVSLTAPRPDQARLHNEYVETPFRTQPSAASPPVPPRPHAADNPVPVSTVAVAPTVPVADEGPTKPQHHHHHLTINRLQSAFGGAPPRTNTITKQPQSFKKSSSFNHHQSSGPLSQPSISSTLPTTRLSRSTIRSSSPPMTMTLPLLVSNSTGGSPPPIPPSPSSILSGASAGAGGAGSSGRVNGSIICPECGRCKCEACRTPRSLPSTWLCKDTCLCSAEAVVDYASCLCCVKAAFYHCASDASAADDPCGCAGGGGHSSTSSLNGAPHGSVVSGVTGTGSGSGAGRYACLALFTLALPCLLCYWPLRLCHYMTESCYDRLLRRGCRCNYNNNNLNINNNHSRQQITRSIHHNLSSLSTTTTTTTTRTPTASIAANLPTPEKRLLDSSGDTF